MKTGDILGFDKKLSRWSELDKIIHRCDNATVNVKNEILCLCDQISDVKEMQPDGLEKVDFLTNQLRMSVGCEGGNSYSAGLILKGLEMLLLSCSGYRKLRQLLILPSAKTIHRHFGCVKYSDMMNISSDAMKQYFTFLKGHQKLCILLADESVIIW